MPTFTTNDTDYSIIYTLTLASGSAYDTAHLLLSHQLLLQLPFIQHLKVK